MLKLIGSQDFGYPVPFTKKAETDQELSQEWRGMEEINALDSRSAYKKRSKDEARGDTRLPASGRVCTECPVPTSAK
jgi:hypothetical protein